MTIRERLADMREEILAIAERHGARNVRVFGPVVRGDASEESDVDFLVSTGAETSSWFPAGLVAELEAFLHRDADVVTEQSLYWILRRRIEEYLREGEVAFQSDHKTQDAVIRNFEVIGEAAKRVLAEYRARHAEIPWQLMAGFRDVLIHAYEAAGPFCLRGMLAVPAGRAC